MGTIYNTHPAKIFFGIPLFCFVVSVFFCNKRHHHSSCSANGSYAGHSDTRYTNPEPTSAYITDINKDGKNDSVVRYNGNNFSIFLKQKNGKYAGLEKEIEKGYIKKYIKN